MDLGSLIGPLALLGLGVIVGILADRGLRFIRRRQPRHRSPKDDEDDDWDDLP